MHFFMNTVHFEIFLSKNYKLFVIFASTLHSNVELCRRKFWGTGWLGDWLCLINEYDVFDVMSLQNKR